VSDFRTRGVAITALLFTLAGSGPAQNYGTGVVALKSGEFAIADKQLRPLAEAGHGNAQYQFGLMYEYGRSYAKSAADAVYWYKKAAMAEHGFAQHDLAFMHLAGKGATRDLVQAYMWLKIAELQGNNLMTKHLRLVARGMTAAEINQSHRLAYQWFAG